MSIEYKLGDVLEFNVYGSTVTGSFIEMDGDSIVIKIIEDYIPQKKGKISRIHKSHRHCIVTS